MGVLRGIVVAYCGLAQVTANAEPAPPAIEEAIANAAAAGKPLLVEVYTTWCGPCREFEKETLSDPRVQAALQQTTFVRYDAEDGPGVTFASKFKVDSFPTLLAIDNYGVEYLRKRGALLGESGVAQLIELIREARSGSVTEDQIVARVKAAPRDERVRIDAARWYAKRDKLDEALAHFDAVAAMASAAQSSRAEAWGAAARIRRIDRWRHQLVDEKVELVRRFAGSATANDLIIATVGSGLSRAEVQSLFAIAFMKQQDSDALNALVYVALAAGASDEALFGAQKLVAQRRDSKHLDTLAECHHARGERLKAVTFANEAWWSAKDGAFEAIITKNQKRFETGTEPSPTVRKYRDRARATRTHLEAIDQPAGLPDSQHEQRFKEQRDRNDQLMAHMTARQKLGVTIAATCAGKAGTADAAYARLVVTADGSVESHVLYVEPGATDALRTCLSGELGKARLPPSPSPNDRKPLLVIAFRRSP